MENSHNGPKCAKTHENNNLELIFLIVQLDKDLFIIKNDFYKFWHYSLQVRNKGKNNIVFSVQKNYFSKNYYSINNSFSYTVWYKDQSTRHTDTPLTKD